MKKNEILFDNLSPFIFSENIHVKYIYNINNYIYTIDNNLLFLDDVYDGIETKNNIKEILIFGGGMIPPVIDCFLKRKIIVNI
jgi:hypothetical protein